MKKTTTQKNKQIAKYTAMAGAFLAGGTVNGQIMYTDINPDVVVDSANPSYALDMNGDVAPDVQFVQGTFAGSFTSSGYNIVYSGAYAAAGAAGTGGGVMNTTGSYAFADNLALNDPICGSANFATGSNAATMGQAGNFSVTAIGYTGTFATGNFLGLTDQYMGVRFTAGANTHYGWVRLDVAADATSITLKDMAYNAMPDGCINAGQTIGLDDIDIENKVSILTHLDEAFINVTPDLFGGNIIMTDLGGREVSSTPITDINTKVTYEGLDSGIYMIVAQFEDGAVSKKVYVR